MKPHDFRVWQSQVNLSGREVAEALGKSEDTISAYRTRGVPARESAVIRLACAAIAAGIAPWFPK